MLLEGTAILETCRAKVKRKCVHQGQEMSVLQLVTTTDTFAFVGSIGRICHDKSPMPSSIGHALGGVAAAWLVDLIPGERGWRTAPASASWRDRAGAGLTAVCAALAVSPDLDLLVRTHRTVTHSLGAVVAVGLIAAAIAAHTRRPALRVAGMCAAAYASHLLFDWLAADRYSPYGLQALWPLSSQWFISGWTIFAQTERRDLLTLATFEKNAAAIARELALIGPIVVLLWLVRVKAFARFTAQVSGRHHPAK